MPSIIAWNALIGGGTAAARALIAGRDVKRAALLGLLGGTVHYSGKYVATRRFDGAGWTGLVVASQGTAIVANAGDGIGVTDRTSIPIGPLRLTFTRTASRRFGARLNAFEAGVIARNLWRKGMEVDWNRTASYGALVFVAPNRRIINGGERPDGLTAAAPVVVISGLTRYPDEVMRHEAVHVHQFWFMQDAWGAPMERDIRSRTPLVRRLPGWLELGLVVPALAIGNEYWFGHNKLVGGAMEAEAYRLQR